MRSRSTLSAFTLVEMSIVLVIIGLIAGGVLVGKELVESAKVRKQVSQLSEYDKAIAAFKLKYDYLPADIPQNRAGAYGLTKMGGCGPGAPTDVCGNGDGYIEAYNGGIPTFSAAAEVGMFQIHLREAGFVTTGGRSSAGYYRVGTNQDFAPLMMNKSAGLLIFTWSDRKLVYLVGLTGSGVYNQHAFGVTAQNPVLMPAQAFALDTKLDDGQPSTGSVFAVYTVINDLMRDTRANTCLTNVGTANEGYYTGSDAVACQLIVHASVP